MTHLRTVELIIFFISIIMTNISIDKIKLEIVSQAIEDTHGLYEIIWTLNTLYPDLSSADKIKQSQIAIQDLITENVIDLYKNNWDTKLEQKLEKQTALTVISNISSWDPPSDNSKGDYYCFYASGDKAIAIEKDLYQKINQL